MTDAFSQALARYADVAVRVGVNVQPGQRLVVRSDINAAPLVREIVRSAYQAGSPFVNVRWTDEQSTLARFRYAPRDSFGEFPTWDTASLAQLVDEGAALLSVTSEDPDLLREQDPNLISLVRRTASEKNQPVLERVTRGVTNWAIVAAPSPGWAAKMFPTSAPSEREGLLWRAIMDACRINTPDPVAAWRAHVADLAARSAYLNAKRYRALRYTGPGTDLTIGLADGHQWISGAMDSSRGVSFVANLPTEEVFTMPHRARVDGIVRATRPLNMGGTLVEDFTLRFEGGRVTGIDAGTGGELLQKLIETDEGAARLGEVALVPERSPIAQSGLLFFNTLFDENAASHIALGAAYRFTMAGGNGKSDAEYAEAGGNSSVVHTDFMIGSAHIDIDGVAADGSTEPVMRGGEWAFTV